MSAAALPLLYEKDGPVATFTLNRPAARNALTPELVCRLADAVADFLQDESLRVGIVTGTGDKAFCAGGDLGTMLPLLTGDRAPADEWDRRVLEEPFVMAASSLRDHPIDKPLVSAINGACLAGGMEMVLGTDIRIAADHAIFGLPEVRRAVIPFAGSLVRLPDPVLPRDGDPPRGRNALRHRRSADRPRQSRGAGRRGHAACAGDRAAHRGERPRRRAGGEVAAVGPTAAADRLVARAVSSFGRLDILCTNAGILRDRVLWNMTDDDFDRVVETHLRGTFTCVRAAVRRMREQKSGGRIVLVSSISSQRGNFGQGNYAAAKAGIAAMAHTWALECARSNITVNAIVPVAMTRMVATIPALAPYAAGG